ncbi:MULTISPECIES: hypothetical protein [Actinosynnema]|uniref:hypothetical protein n=1 Tax=Actinosynnema TaxID=40566 RepID=UPI0020A47CAD|nr:hypothetical protein [Actinosynnema pretiosum]
MSDRDRVRATATRLRELLTDHAPYRRRWERSLKSHRHKGREINQAMVCQTLAEYQRDKGEESERDLELPRRLKDKVSRALAGHVLGSSVLRLFTDAFEMSQLHRAELWALFSGGDPARLVVLSTEQGVPEKPAAPLSYQTINLHEFHTVGADGLPAAHRTVHVVRALGPLRGYAYRFDTSAATVEVLRGGTAGPVYRTAEPDVYAVDIVFHHPLEPGQTTSFEYRTLFDYSAPPPAEFRRACRNPVENVSLDVQFHPDLLPEAVWWSIWDGLDGPITEQMPEPLKQGGSVHRYVDAFEGVAGFHWTFGDRAPSRPRRR